MTQRVESRWNTRFGSFIGSMTVRGIVEALEGDPQTRITPNAVYGWLSGHMPDPPRAKALVDLSRGTLTFDDIYSHRDQVAGSEGACASRSG